MLDAELARKDGEITELRIENSKLEKGSIEENYRATRAEQKCDDAMDDIRQLFELAGGLFRITCNFFKMIAY